jgi:hypothetical protein
MIRPLPHIANGSQAKAVFRFWIRQIVDGPRFPVFLIYITYNTFNFPPFVEPEFRGFGEASCAGLPFLP